MIRVKTPITLTIIGLMLLIFFFLYISSEDTNSAPTNKEKDKLIATLNEAELHVYKEAGEKYDVDWEVLAAIHYKETNMAMKTTYTHGGAHGPMQLIKCVWIGVDYTPCQQNWLADIPIEQTYKLDVIAKNGGYGKDGNEDGIADLQNFVDSVHTAAYYLSSHKYRKDPEEAIYNYNASRGYVEDVQRYMGYIQQDSKNS